MPKITKRKSAKKPAEKPDAVAKEVETVVEEVPKALQESDMIPLENAEDIIEDVQIEDSTASALQREIDSDISENDDGANSSDDESPVAATAIPQLSKQAQQSIKAAAASVNAGKKASKKRKGEAERGVVYLGRIPHGFYEDQMRGYFKQFGVITKLRLSRNVKTGRSKHYGFIEFKHKEVADVVAETMDGYILFGRILKCKIVPKEKIPRGLWKGHDSKFVVCHPYKRDMKRQNKGKTEQEYLANVYRLSARETRLRKKLASAGIDYDFKGYDSMPKAVAK